MNYDEFSERIKSKNIAIKITPEHRPVQHGLDNESLFQLPLIAMIILLLSKDRRKPQVSEIGQLVGELLEDTMIGFKSSNQYLGWSANLRIRTVTALNFLEAVKLVYINKNDTKLNITDLGKKVITKAFEYDSDLSYNLELIERAYRNNCVDKKLNGELI